MQAAGFGLTFVGKKLLAWFGSGKVEGERRWTGPIVREESKVLNDANLGSSVKTDEKERNRKSGIHMGEAKTRQLSLA